MMSILPPLNKQSPDLSSRGFLGWGRRIRTPTYGSRVRCPTVRRAPSVARRIVARFSFLATARRSTPPRSGLTAGSPSLQCAQPDLWRMSWKPSSSRSSPFCSSSLTPSAGQASSSSWALESANIPIPRRGLRNAGSPGVGMLGGSPKGVGRLLGQRRFLANRAGLVEVAGLGLGHESGLSGGFTSLNALGA